MSASAPDDRPSEQSATTAERKGGGFMSPMEHLLELRHRLMWSLAILLIAFVLSFAFAENIYEFLVQPLATVLAERGDDYRMIYTDLTEVFFVYLRVAFFAAFMLAFPVIAVQIWMFVAPGLYTHEKRAFLPFLISTPILFILGSSLAYYIIFPLAWRFFLSFEINNGEGVLPIQLEAKVNEYLGLVMSLIFAFGLSFQLPVLLTLLARAGMINAAFLKSGRKYALVLVFVAAAVLTPPDVISQIGLAIPIFLLYELSILSVSVMERRRSRERHSKDKKRDFVAF